jgi:hypothetical protein
MQIRTRARPERLDPYARLVPSIQKPPLSRKQKKLRRALPEKLRSPRGFLKQQEAQRCEMC